MQKRHSNECKSLSRFELIRIHIESKGTAQDIE
jgi:hypothetical protein